MSDSDSDSDYNSEADENPLLHGPLIRPLQKSRSLTDVVCLVLYSIFIICWLIVAILAFTYGNLKDLQPAPTDSNGRRCGIDIEMKQRPFLLYFDITKYYNGSYSTTSTCLKECPKTNFFYKKNVTQDIKSIIPKLICEEGIDVDSINSWDTLDKYMKEAKCAYLYLDSKPLFNRCVPKGIPDEFQIHISNATVAQLEKFINAQIAKENMLYYIYFQGSPMGKYIILEFTLLAGVLSIMYVITLRWSTKILVYLSINASCAFALLAVCLAAISYNSDTSQYLLLIDAIVMSILFVLFVSSVIFARNKINTACKLLKETCKIVPLPSSLICFTILLFFLCVLIALFGSAVELYISTITEDVFKVKMSNDSCNCPSCLNYSNGSLCDPNIFMRECKTSANTTCIESGCRFFQSTIPTKINFIWYFNRLGILLFILFIVTFRHMVLAGTFAEWYWTLDKTLYSKFTLLKMVGITLRYHCGSLAIGSPLVVYEFFCDALTRYTFIVIAAHGEKFYRSLKFGGELVVRNTNNFLVLNKAVNFPIVAGSFSIAGLTTTLAWLSCNSFFKEDATVDEIGISIFLIIIAGLSFFIANFLISTLKTAMDTTCICFLEDTVRNDGSEEKPYFAPFQYRELLQTLSPDTL